MGNSGKNDRWASLLKWEFELAGRVPLNWVLSAKALILAADFTYERYSHSVQLYEELYYRDPATGIPKAVERSLSQEEVAVLRDQPLGSVALMLLGFAFENIAKSSLVQNDSAHVTAEEGLDSDLKTHDLVKLVAACGVSLDAGKNDALSFLTEYTTWAGRYPIPVRPLQGFSPMAKDGFFVRRRFSPIRDIWKAARPLYDVLSSQLDSVLGDTTDK